MVSGLHDAADRRSSSEGDNRSCRQSSGPDGLQKYHQTLGEVTNLVWGAFKARYIAEGDKRGQFQTQVPIIINHHQKYISFGSEDPQLCFRYTLTDNTDEDKPPIHVYQRFVFNLNWSPEDFKEVQTSCEELVESGELELF